MAKTNKFKEKDTPSKSKKKTRAPKKEKKDSKLMLKIQSFFNDDRTQKSLGLLFILTSLYLFICFTSYLFTWKSDYSIIDGKSFSFVFSGEEVIVKNWLGKLGGFTAHKFLKVWFGIASYIFPFLLFLFGIRVLFKITLLPLLKTIKISAVSLVWTSILMAFLFASPLDFMGGLFGHQIISTIKNIAGSIGAGLFIAFTGYLAVIVLFNPSYSWIEKLKLKINANDPAFIPSDENEAINPIKEEEIKNEQETVQVEENQQVEAEIVKEEPTSEELLQAEKDKFLRLFAEFENYKKRTTRERIELFKTAGQEVMTSLLPVVDDFERALSHIEDDKEAEELRKGVLLIYNKFYNTLEQKGLSKIETKAGDTFDAEIHEAITQIPAPSEDLKGKVIDCVEKGYKLGDKIIRYPKVVIGQ